VKRLVVVLAIAACGRARALRCDDDLRGVWAAPAGRWMMLDNRATLEAYPMAPDAAIGSDVTGAPRVLDLSRTPSGLAGELHRRDSHGAATCEARSPVHITACTDDTLEVVLADPPAPLQLAPCRWPAPEPARVERWRRER